MKELEEIVIAFVKANIKYEGEINSDSTLSDDFGIGSFDKLMIMNAIEDHFSITFEESELASVKSIRDLTEAVAKLIPNKE